jgi:hypothetical protein
MVAGWTPGASVWLHGEKRKAEINRKNKAGEFLPQKSAKERKKKKGGDFNREIREIRERNLENPLTAKDGNFIFSQV